MRFTGILRPEEFRIVTRAHVIAWRDDLVRRGLGGSTIRNRLASIASLFEYLCEKNAVTGIFGSAALSLAISAIGSNCVALKSTKTRDASTGTASAE